MLEAFLIVHRNHELRFVPEGVDEILEDTLGIFRGTHPEVIEEAKQAKVNWTAEKHEWQQMIERGWFKGPEKE